MLKILHAACLGLSVVISAQFTLEMCLAAQNRQKSIKTTILMFKVIQVFDGNQMYDFLLVINLGPISHRF